MHIFLHFYQNSIQTKIILLPFPLESRYIIESCHWNFAFVYMCLKLVFMIFSVELWKQRENILVAFVMETCELVKYKYFFENFSFVHNNMLFNRKTSITSYLWYNFCEDEKRKRDFILTFLLVAKTDKNSFV